MKVCSEKESGNGFVGLGSTKVTSLLGRKRAGYLGTDICDREGMEKIEWHVFDREEY
jgi:hypothetical protein